MRIELPLPSWAEAQRAQDDAHTLTVPAQHPQAPHPLLAAMPVGDEVSLRVEVVTAAGQAVLTLTF